jgi:hypothetical protein
MPQASPTTVPSDAALSALCNTAKSALTAAASSSESSPFTFLVAPGYCRADTASQLTCEQTCPARGGCDAQASEGRCSARGGTCRGTCNGECQGTSSKPVSCSNSCQGTCFGTCEGACTRSDGSQTTGTEPCNGWCTGSCKGPCAGICWQASSCSEGICWDSAAQSQSCEGTLENPVCRVPFTPSTCFETTVCSGSCALLAAIRQQCEPTRVTLFGSTPSQALRTTVETNFGPLFDVLLQSPSHAHATALLDPPGVTAAARNAGTKALNCVGAANQMLSDSAQSVQAALNAAQTAVSPPTPPGDAGFDGSTSDGGFDFCPSRSRALGNAPLIDDMEDQDTFIFTSDLRQGTWFNYDSGGIQSPAIVQAIGRSPSEFGIHTASMSQDGGTRIPGGGVGFDLQPGGICYDARAYSGLRFWGLGPGRIEVTLRTASNGIACSHPTQCDFHRMTIDLTNTWTQYDLPWNVFLRSADVTPLDPSQLYTVFFHSRSQSYAFWIDDVSFLAGDQ